MICKYIVWPTLNWYLITNAEKKVLENGGSVNKLISVGWKECRGKLTGLALHPLKTGSSNLIWNVWIKVL